MSAERSYAARENTFARSASWMYPSSSISRMRQRPRHEITPEATPARRAAPRRRGQRGPASATNDAATATARIQKVPGTRTSDVEDADAEESTAEAIPELMPASRGADRPAAADEHDDEAEL